MRFLGARDAAALADAQVRAMLHERRWVLQRFVRGFLLPLPRPVPPVPAAPSTVHAPAAGRALGYRFDLRLYVLALGGGDRAHGLKLYLFRDGVVRPASVPLRAGFAARVPRFDPTRSGMCGADEWETCALPRPSDGERGGPPRAAAPAPPPEAVDPDVEAQLVTNTAVQQQTAAWSCERPAGGALPARARSVRALLPILTREHTLRQLARLKKRAAGGGSDGDGNDDGGDDDDDDFDDADADSEVLTPDALWARIRDAVAAVFARVPPVSDADADLTRLLGGAAGDAPPGGAAAAARKLLRDARGLCQSLYGVDVLLDARLRPLVIEVQLSPNPHPACPVDVETKAKLARGVMALLLAKGGPPAAGTDAFERLALPGDDDDVQQYASDDAGAAGGDDDDDEARQVAIELPVIGADGKLRPLTMFEDEAPGDAAARFCAEHLSAYQAVVAKYAASENATEVGFNPEGRDTERACVAFMEGLVRENMSFVVGPLVRAQREWREAHGI